jgi:hypothetical protein
MQVDGGTGLTVPVAPDELRHASKVVGALPIINHFPQLLGLDELFQRFQLPVFREFMAESRNEHVNSWRNSTMSALIRL